MKNYSSSSLEQTREIAKQWLSTLVATNEVTSESDITESKGATIVGLSGHLGAGKTAFVKMVARWLGIKDEITSPTYVIMKMYGINKRYSTVKSSIESIPYPWKRLVHIDAYRLEKYEELEVLGWEQLIADAGNLIIVEWPENAGIDRNKNPELIELGFEIVDDKYNIKEV
ncbi:MAG: tRNA (adenosine(37)-N6)-threonylcarbamoyltransferase complex ATPase subunit type 1 TsaE [Candidatus Taylorbacteria bacterium]